MLETRTIQQSKSSPSAAIIFVRKVHGLSLYLCIEYRAINKIMITNRCRLPIMTEAQNCVSVSKIFTKLDPNNGYDVIRITEGEEEKTSFHCYYRLDEFLVMPFSLSNASASFHGMMKHSLKDLRTKGLVVDIKAILIYTQIQSNTKYS
jgi:hypothetical protein